MATVIRMILAGFISLTCVGGQVFPSFAYAKDDLSMKKLPSYYDGPCNSGDGFGESARALCKMSEKYRVAVITAERIAEIKPVLPPAPVPNPPQQPRPTKREIFASLKANVGHWYTQHTRRDPHAWKAYQTAFRPTGNSAMPARVHRVADPVAANELARRLLQKAPLAIQEIVACESGRKHYNEKTGYVLQGEITPGDVGFSQINTLVHAEDAMRDGFNPYSIYGNIGFAIKLYIKEGTKPWNSSKKCWGPKVPPQLRLPLSEQM